MEERIAAAEAEVSIPIALEEDGFLTVQSASLFPRLLFAAHFSQLCETLCLDIDERSALVHRHWMGQSRHAMAVS